MYESSSNPLIELENVSMKFGEQEVLRDISLTIFPQETVALIGESGCGKSVMTKLMAALLSPTTGTVRWNGREIGELNQKEIHRERLRIGYLFQSGALFDSMSVFENIAFGLTHNTTLRMTRIEQIVQEQLRNVGLPAETAHKQPSELSGGMRKRVAMARTLALSPEIVLYDEPTTGLDPVMSDVINYLILKTRQKNHVTSIVVTHDMHTVQKVADRVVMLVPLDRLEPGEPQILFDGTPEEAFASTDPQISQFINGEAGERLEELAA